MSEGTDAATVPFGTQATYPSARLKEVRTSTDCSIREASETVTEMATRGHAQRGGPSARLLRGRTCRRPLSGHPAPHYSCFNLIIAMTKLSMSQMRTVTVAITLLRSATAFRKAFNQEHSHCRLPPAIRRILKYRGATACLIPSSNCVGLLRPQSQPLVLAAGGSPEPGGLPSLRRPIRWCPAPPEPAPGPASLSLRFRTAPITRVHTAKRESRSRAPRSHPLRSLSPSSPETLTSPLGLTMATLCGFAPGYPLPPLAGEQKELRRPILPLALRKLPGCHLLDLHRRALIPHRDFRIRLQPSKPITNIPIGTAVYLHGPTREYVVRHVLIGTQFLQNFLLNEGIEVGLPRPITHRFSQSRESHRLRQQQLPLELLSPQTLLGHSPSRPTIPLFIPPEWELRWIDPLSGSCHDYWN